MSEVILSIFYSFFFCNKNLFDIFVFASFVRFQRGKRLLNGRKKTYLKNDFFIQPTNALSTNDFAVMADSYTT